VPAARWLHSAVLHEASSTMYVFGGVAAHFVPLDDFWAYSVAANKWSQPAASNTPPFPRMMHTSACVGNLVFVLGGLANNLPFDDAWIFDVARGTWTPVPHFGSSPTARHGAAAVVLAPPAATVAPDYRAPLAPLPPPSSAVLLSDEASLPPAKLAAAVVRKGITPRPRYRTRKQYYDNRFLVLFGGTRTGRFD